MNAVRAVLFLALAGLAAAGGDSKAGWGVTPAGPCLNPVCKPTCVPTCKVSTLSCANTTATFQVCNYKCTVPEPTPSPVITPISFNPKLVPAAAPAPGAGRRLMGKEDSKKGGMLIVKDSGYAPTPNSYGKEYVPVSKPPALVVPPKLPPLPECTQSCTNVTGYAYACTPKPCTKLVEKSRIETNCTIQCQTPTATNAVPAAAHAAAAGRRLHGDDSKVSYEPVGQPTYAPVDYADYAATPGATPAAAGVATPQCQQVCVSYKVKYQDVECVSDDCKDTDCSGPQECTCADTPADNKKKDDKSKTAFTFPTIPGIPLLNNILAPIAGLFGR